MDHPVKFHVISDHFQIPDEEILKNDFLGRHSIIINFETE